MFSSCLTAATDMANGPGHWFRDRDDLSAGVTQPYKPHEAKTHVEAICARAVDPEKIDDQYYLRNCSKDVMRILFHQIRKEEMVLFRKDNWGRGAI